MKKAVIALGSNIGDTLANLKEAVAMLEDDGCNVLSVSRLYQTEPWGYADQDDFLNGCLELETLLTPHELLEVLHKAEQQEKRERLIHWGPRTLDLDLLFYDDEILESPELVVPHPEIEKRTFVLEPLAQIAPWKVHPVLKKRIKTLLEELENK